MSYEKEIRAGVICAQMSFSQKVWAMCSRIPRGRVTSYGEIARALGCREAPRAVGSALNRNPYAPEVPCHRVVAADGRLTGYAKGLSAKRTLLQQEGVPIIGDRVDPAARFNFDRSQ